MRTLKFPALPLKDWQGTRDTLHAYVRVLGAIRRALTPPARHWSHISLQVGETGLTTGPIWEDPFNIEISLDLTVQRLTLSSERGVQWIAPLSGQPVSNFLQELLLALASVGIHPDLDRTRFNDATPRSYDVSAAQRYWDALSSIDQVLKQFKSELPGETSPVQLWPHHFDLALLWFSGRKVPGVDPADEERADEQMNFGFSTGDERIPDAYFYITAYPMPDTLRGTPLPKDATWHSNGWQGALMMYQSLAAVENAGDKLLNLLRTVQRAGAEAMSRPALR